MELEKQAAAAKLQHAGEALAESVAMMARLRAPGGCPWDREQTFDTIKRYTLEETYEVFDAIERRNWPDLKDELGDLLLQVLFYAQMAADEGHFTISDVAENLNAKLIRRHPHVFGEVEATDANAVLRNWEQIKVEEKRAKPASASMLDDVPRTMPATLEATKLGSKAAKVGFDWPDADGLFLKLDEEIGELKAEVAPRAARNADPSAALRDDNVEAPRDDNQKGKNDKHTERIEEEFGDVMFTAMNLARHLKIDAESALRRSNAKFRKRFAAMEAAAGGRSALEGMDAEHLEQLWAEAKQAEARIDSLEAAY